MPLACGLGANNDFNMFLVNNHISALFGRANRGLYVIGHTNAKQLTSKFCLSAAIFNTTPICYCKRAVHIDFILATVVSRPNRVGVGHLRRLDQVFPSQFNSVHAGLMRGFIDQTLYSKDHFWPPRASKSLSGHGVGIHSP